MRIIRPAGLILYRRRAIVRKKTKAVIRWTRRARFGAGPSWCHPGRNDWEHPDASSPDCTGTGRDCPEEGQLVPWAGTWPDRFSGHPNG